MGMAYGDGPPIAGGGMPTGGAGGGAIGDGGGAANCGGATAPPSACPHELQNFKPAGVAAPHFGHFPPAATGGAAGIDAATGFGGVTGAATAGAATIAPPHPVQNFKPGATLVPHFGHFAPAAGGGATGIGAATGFGGAGGTAGAETTGAAPIAPPHPVQNFNPGATLVPHFGHFAPAATGGAGAATGAPITSPHELQNSCPDWVSLPQMLQLAICPPLPSFRATHRVKVRKLCYIPWCP